MALKSEEYKVGEEPKKKETKEVKMPDPTSATEAIVEQNKLLIQILAEKQTGSNQQSGGLTEEGLGRLLSAVQEGNKESTGQFEYNKTWTADTIDPDDVLPKEEWVTFMVHQSDHVIACDVKGGRPIPAPFKVIKFEYEHTRKQQHGKDTHIMQLSKYTCKSKIELDFLLNHTWYGISFFKDMKSATTMDARKASLLMTISQQMQTYDPNEIVQMCKLEGIPVTDSAPEMRAKLAELQVDRQIASIEKGFNSSVEEQYLEAEKLGVSVN